MFQSFGEYVKAEEYLQKALQIKREIGDKSGESKCYVNLGNVFGSLGKLVKAENIVSKQFRSAEKLVTKKKKHFATEAWERPFFVLVNI